MNIKREDVGKTAQRFGKAGLTLILGKENTTAEVKREHYIKLLGAVVLTFVILLFAWRIVQTEINIKKLESTYINNQVKIERMIEEKMELLRQLDYINSDNYVKEMARSKLDMLRPGEIMFVRK